MILNSKQARAPQDDGANKRSFPENNVDPLVTLDWIKQTFGFKVSRWTLYRLIKDGRFPAPTKLGHQRFWRRSDVEQCFPKRIPPPAAVTADLA